MNPEQLVVGACLLDSHAFRSAAKHVTPDDFADPRLGQVFAIIAAMTTLGEPVEPGTVAARMAQRGVRGLGAVDLHHFVAGVASSASAEFYAQQMREESLRRQLRIVAARAATAANDPAAPPMQTIAATVETLRDIRNGQDATSLPRQTLEEVLSVPDDDDWLVEGLFKPGDRMILTGHEGLGKSTWIRQMAIMFAAGINPVTLQHVEPIRVEVVDVENSAAQWRYESRAMALGAFQYRGVDPRPLLGLTCPGRLDVTSADVLGKLHRLVDDHDPKILFLGPIYKLVPHGINNDDDAAPLITALDSLRDRGLVMVMEGHSPKGGGTDRDLSPRGSAALMGWPEFGFGLGKTASESRVEVVRWRGDRDARRKWPHSLHRGGPFPWMADGVSPERFQQSQRPRLVAVPDPNQWLEGRDSEG